MLFTKAELALIIPSLTSAGENKKLRTENLSKLKRKEEANSRHLSYSVYCVSIKTLTKVLAVVHKEKLPQ